MARCSNPNYLFQVKWSIVWVGVILFLACTDADHSVDEQKVDLFSSRSAEGDLQAVVETPMGSFIPQGYNIETKQIEPIGTASATMLPYICHSGFIPIEGQDQIPVWITGKQVAKGQILGIKPVALLEYESDGQTVTEVLAIPLDTSLQTIRPASFSDLIVTYEPMQYFLTYWLRNRYGVGSTSRIIWKDDQAALQFVEAKITNR
ncbi:MAG: hypothetical protein HKN87_10575 [Saprospiraceae bacterium]|nr:hypothetical protein [Saprospiraceae bacterium]